MAQFIGFSFPFRKGTTSFPEVATDDALIKESLLQLILTGKGERIMRPDVGSLAFTYLFESEDALLLQRAQYDIANLIGKYEPRVALLAIGVTRGDATTPAATSASTVIITIQYIVIKTQTTGSSTITIGAG